MSALDHETALMTICKGCGNEVGVGLDVERDATQVFSLHCPSCGRAIEIVISEGGTPISEFAETLEEEVRRAARHIPAMRGEDPYRRSVRARRRGR